MTGTEVQETVKEWHRNKAKNENDQFYRFMCHWICFNAWLENQSGKSRDREMINWLKAQSTKSSDIISAYEEMKATTVGSQNLTTLVAMAPILGSKGRQDISLRDIDDRDNVIEAIYRIRCNLFHGGKRSSNVRDTKLLTCVNHIMTKWIDALIAKW